MRRRKSEIFLPLILFLTAAFCLSLAQGTGSVPDPVKKIFAAHCSVRGCHEGRGAASNLDLGPAALSKAVNAPSLEKPQLKIIDAQAPEKSYLLMKIRGDKDLIGGRMPLGRTPLKDEDIKTIQNWIEGLKGGSSDDPAPTAPGGSYAKKKFEEPAFRGLRQTDLPIDQFEKRNELPESNVPGTF